MFVLTFQFPYILKTVGVYPIYVLILFTGLARGFNFPAQSAFTATLVPRELYANSSTWNSLVWHIAAISGPAFGGLLYGFWGVNVAYSAVIVFGVMAVIFFMNVNSRPVPVKEKSETLVESLLVGIRFVFKNQIILGALSLDMFAVLFGGATAMLPVFAGEILKVGPEGLGLLRAAPAVGAVFMGVFLAFYPPLENSGKKLFFSIAGFGVSIILFAISKNFYLSFFFLMLSGIFDNVSVIIRSTTIQLFTPDEMRGRVASINSIFVGSSNEIGSFESGLAARIMTLVPSVVFGGVMTILIVGGIANIAPNLRRLNLKDYMR